MIDLSQISAIILAGGQALRMGGVDKGLVDLEQQRLIEHVLNRIRPQVGPIMISANRNHAEYQHYGYPVLQDKHADYQGPLSGIAEGLQKLTTAWLLVVPCDSPQLPTDLVSRLYQAVIKDTSLASIAHNGDYLQPAFNLIHASLLPSLLHYLKADDRKLAHWLRQHQPSIVDFSDQPESFININSSEQLSKFQFQTAPR